MTFNEVLSQTIAMLQQHGRVSHRALRRQFAIDDAFLEDLKYELVEVQQCAVGHDGIVLVWTGDASAAAMPFPGPAPSAAAPPIASRLEPESLAYTPSHLAEKILTSRSALEGKRKQVTVLFADLKASMELLADRDLEEARRVLDPVLERMMAAVHRYEGTVNQIMGDRIMALFGAPSTQRLDPETAVGLARNVNDRLAQAISPHPDRFAGFAALPTPDPKAAADELERAVTQLRFKGATVHGLTNGVFLDDKRFWPIFERAQALDAPLYVHPAVPHRAVAEAYYQDYLTDFPALRTAAWGFTVETATHAIRLVLSGVFDVYPDVKIILGHMGEGLPFLLWRINHALSRPGNRPMTTGIRFGRAVRDVPILAVEKVRFVGEMVAAERAGEREVETPDRLEAALTLTLSRREREAEVPESPKL